ncbi:THAP domain-containing protein 7 [Liparis tanakae]|uniref:THAP domain-containing protein 7 n=1 Tax=Liparis tanakae TaxID=230148 RepID=A0A4Z2GLI1_9TELE|nr:THAP domain-containing protein 7 [Liparis tanakae]
MKEGKEGREERIERKERRKERKEGNRGREGGSEERKKKKGGRKGGRKERKEWMEEGRKEREEGKERKTPSGKGTQRVYSLGQLSASLAVMLLLQAEQSVVAETVSDVNRRLRAQVPGRGLIGLSCRGPGVTQRDASCLWSRDTVHQAGGLQPAPGLRHIEEMNSDCECKSSSDVDEGGSDKKGIYNRLRNSVNASSRRLNVGGGLASYSRPSASLFQSAATEMPRHCSAGGCKSRDNRVTRNAGITFHKLPKGAARRNLWITNSHRADSWDPQTDFVYFCSKHFSPDSFELTGCSGIRRLKEDAFPTVFDSSSSIKCKRPGALQTQEDLAPLRVPPSEEPALQRSPAAVEESNANTPASSEEHLSQQDCSPAAAACPLSPSRFMRRLPPPLGFYLPKEHSYAQLCPLLWRRRYDQAVDCLEKALRQLHAARRRENRLRSAVLRLHDQRDGGQSRGGWTPAGERRAHQEVSENDGKSEDTGVCEDRGVDQTELGSPFPPATTSWSEEEKAYCCYCGRGQPAPGAHRDPKTGEDVQPTGRGDPLQTPRCPDTADDAEDKQVVRLERPPGTRVETSGSNPRILLQTRGLQHAPPAAGLVPETHEQSLQKLLPDHSEGQTDAVGHEHHLDLQLLWIQDGLEGGVVLMPVPAEEGLHRVVADEAQTIVVSGVDLTGDSGRATEDSGGPSRVQPGDEEQSGLRSALNTTVVEMGEDVREKLKEHLEGFHLQLSSEFRN